jgi:hypothetical protein
MLVPVEVAVLRSGGASALQSRGHHLGFLSHPVRGALGPGHCHGQPRTPPTGTQPGDI